METDDEVYPIRPADRPYDESRILNARIKPLEKRIELDMELHTMNDNYSKAKGEQFALNVDGKPGSQFINSNLKKQNKEEPRYYQSNVMDKTVLVSSNGTPGQMNQLYHLGLLKENGVHLTPVQAVLQMRPSFEHFDIYERKVKETREAQGDTDYSTEDDDGECDKAELVTLKYSSAHASQAVKKEPEQNWIQLKFANVDERSSAEKREALVCQVPEKGLKLDFTQEEFIQKLINTEITNNVSSTNSDMTTASNESK